MLFHRSRLPECEVGDDRNVDVTNGGVSCSSVVRPLWGAETVADPARLGGGQSMSHQAPKCFAPLKRSRVSHTFLWPGSDAAHASANPHKIVITLSHPGNPP